MTTWKELLEAAMQERGETFDNIVANTLSDVDMNDEFDDGFGGINGCPFTVWTNNTVYFPVHHSGSEWVGSVSRHPDGKPTQHQGGG